MTWLATLTCDNCGLADGDVETASKDTVDGRYRMCDVVALALTRASCQADEDALVMLPRGYAQRRPRYLGRYLVYAGHLDVARRA